MNWTLISNFAAALFAITNPIGNLPIFLSYVGTEKRSVQRLLGLFLALTVFAAQVIFQLLGDGLLSFFGISMAAFRVAGGILLLLIGIQMVQGKREVSQSDLARQGGSDLGAAKLLYQRVLVPLGIPIFVGPGAIGTAILFAGQADSGLTRLGLLMAALGVSLLTWGILNTAHWLERLLGNLGLVILGRLFGLVLGAIGVQFIFAGLAEAIPRMIDPRIL